MFAFIANGGGHRRRSSGGAEGLVNRPLILLSAEPVHLVPLHVACEDGLRRLIVRDRHLEQEHIIWCRRRAIHFIAHAVEVVAVAQELAAEPAEDQNVLAVQLAGAAPLPLREHLVVHFNLGPFVLVGLVVPLDRVDVLSRGVGDAAENVDGGVAEAAGAVVMPANIQIGHLEPQVDVGVVHLALGLRAVLLLARAGHDDELLPEPAGRVPVPRVLHRVPLYELVVVVYLDFVQGVQGVIITLVVAAADEEELLRVGVLHALEVVWEAAIVIRLHLDRLHRLVADVELVNILGVLLQKMNYLNWGA